MSDLAWLLESLEKDSGPDNEIDIAVDLVLFRPDARYTSVRANAAGTKLVYTKRDGRHETCWADDHTLNAACRAKAADRVRALAQQAKPQQAKP